MSKPWLVALLLILPCTGQASEDAETRRTVHYICAHPGETEIIEKIFRLDWDADLVMALLSNDRDHAISMLAGELAVTASELDLLRKDSACQKNSARLEKARQRIYPALRVLAASNQVTPIPGLLDDKAVQKILQQAIADNPGHYQKMLERRRQQAEHYSNEALRRPSKP